MTLELALAAAAVMALSGLVSLLFPRSRPAGDRAFALLMTLGGALALAAGLGALRGERGAGPRAAPGGEVPPRPAGGRVPAADRPDPGAGRDLRRWP